MKSVLKKEPNYPRRTLQCFSVYYRTLGTFHCSVMLKLQLLVRNVVMFGLFQHLLGIWMIWTHHGHFSHLRRHFAVDVWLDDCLPPVLLQGFISQLNHRKAGQREAGAAEQQASVREQHLGRLL